MNDVLFTLILIQMKTGLFAEHSNQLWNISGVPSWSKVNAGLIKMYEAEVIDCQSVFVVNYKYSLFEVLKKFTVTQHFVFGSLFRFEPNE